MKKSIITIVIFFVFLNSLVAQGYSSKEYLADVNFQYGNTYYNESKYFDALRYFQTSLAYEPESYLTNVMAGITCHALEYYASMIHYFQKAVDISDISQSYGNLGSIYAEIGYAKPALKNLNIALDMNPNYAYALNNMGSLLTHRSEDEKAIKLYRKAMLFDKKMPDPWYNIGTIHEEGEQLDSALYYYNKAIEVSPKYIKAIVRKASVLKKSGAAENEYADICHQLIERCNKSLLDNPRAYETRNIRAQMYTLLDQSEKTKDDLEATLSRLDEFVELYPHSYIFLTKRGTAHKLLGNTVEAIADYRRALDINPEFKTAKSGLEKLETAK